MQSYTTLRCLLSPLGSLLVTFLLFLQSADVVAEEVGPSSLLLLPRGLIDSVTLPVQRQTLQSRSPANNSTFGGGFSTLTLTNDRQCVSHLYSTSLCVLMVFCWQVIFHGHQGRPFQFPSGFGHRLCGPLAGLDSLRYGDLQELPAVSFGVRKSHFHFGGK